MDGFFEVVGLVSFCSDLTGDLDRVRMRSVRGSIRGCEGGRFVVVEVVVTGCEGGDIVTFWGSGRMGSGGGGDSDGVKATG